MENIELNENPSLLLDEESKSYICPDFFSESEKIIGEIHSHIGRLKPAQQNKIARDVLKMILYDKIHGSSFQKYIVVCDLEEIKQLSGDSFLSVAIREYEIKLELVDIPPHLCEKLKDAMRKQDLT